ncbi:PEP-CTERM sorting domain-containing protein [Roseibacillus ishigakijimensis]|uniref:PEP-CTERM sorting domain-containing protein n=1 Tax=Roseibacillus ishigakijimensis TaxID=454146 RepID=A0A934VJC8_9BACT|nr:PEP-CTERM sorting domain-containing protein [Roseibacillus ishigakijimensis]MBK1832459.1 PEP-CTERM sorting domain-containing protein [Roseibacillus ishigakijimensis]
MKKSLLSLLAIAPLSHAATYTTSFDAPTYSAGPLSFQDNWLSQDQWQADGAGNVTTSSGGFIRMQNSTVGHDNSVGSTASISSTFTLLGEYDATADAPQIANITMDWQEGIFVHGLSDQTDQAAPDLRGSTVGLYFEPSGTADPDTLELRGAGLTTVSLGSASLYNGHTWTLAVDYTHTGAGSYTVTASLDSLNDAAPAFTATGTATLGDLAGASLLHGVSQSLPVGGTTGGNRNVYDGISVSEYSFTGVPEPSSLLLCGLGALGLLRRKR